MLTAAVEAGADSVYCGLRDRTNARNFAGLNFSPQELRDAVAWAHARKVKVMVAINTFARAGEDGAWRDAVDTAVWAGADALIVADLGVLAYARRAHPGARLHLSVQAAAGSAEAIAFYAEAYGVKRVVLPRVLSTAEIATLAHQVSVETEAFVYGGLCVMAEGRCALSSYAAGESPNLNGVCSPPEAVSFERGGGSLKPRLGGFALDALAETEPAGYPTVCKGRFLAEGEAAYLFEEPVSLNAMEMLRALHEAGVRAVKIEGRQRGKAYVARVTAAFRAAIDALARGDDPAADPDRLAALAEGGRHTTGAYRKTWR
jgi:putative protease